MYIIDTRVDVVLDVRVRISRCVGVYPSWGISPSHQRNNPHCCNYF
jgi:hypothetical protein